MGNSWLFYALLSALMAALVGVFGKVGLRDMDANVATAVRAVIMAVFLLCVAFARGGGGSFSSVLSNGKGMFFVLLSGIAGALSWLFYFLALKDGKVSQVMPIDKLSVVFASVIAVVFLGESMSFTSAVGIVLIASGAILVAL